MKKYANWLLFACLLLSVGLCVWAMNYDLQLLLFLPAVPCFLGQLWLSRVAGRKSLRRLLRGLLPGLVLVWIAAGLLICCFASGWDALLGLIMLCGAPALVVGVGLGWFLIRRREREGKRHDG